MQSSIIGAHDETVMKPHEDRDLCEAFSGHDEATKHHEAVAVLHVELREAEATIMVQSNFSS